MSAKGRSHGGPHNSRVSAANGLCLAEQTNSAAITFGAGCCWAAEKPVNNGIRKLHNVSDCATI